MLLQTTAVPHVLTRLCSLGSLKHLQDKHNSHLSLAVFIRIHLKSANHSLTHSIKDMASYTEVIPSKNIKWPSIQRAGLCSLILVYIKTSKP